MRIGTTRAVIKPPCGGWPRLFRLFPAFLCLGVPGLWAADDGGVIKLTPPDEIIRAVEAARPLNGGAVPGDFASRFGITHYGGRYHLTDKPFLVEGVDQIAQLGFRATKLWLSAKSDVMARGYFFNTSWPKFTRRTRLVDVAQIPCVQEALDRDLDLFLLETSTFSGDAEWRSAPYGSDAYFADCEEQVYELAVYLLKRYRNRKVTFILQNWAGDWLLQGKEGVEWGKNPEGVPEDVDQRVAGMIRYFQALQRGVERARAEVPGKAVVAHAIKINQILENLDLSFPGWRNSLEIPRSPGRFRLPSVLTHVVPRARPDMVICAAYETRDHHPVDLWHLIELMRAFTPPSALYGSDNAAIGELGLRENIPASAEAGVRAYWDRVMGVAFAQKLPFVVFWELYCNSAVGADGRKIIPTGDKQYYGRQFPADKLCGFWFLKPDGTPGFAGKYFLELLERSRRGSPAGSRP